MGMAKNLLIKNLMEDSFQIIAITETIKDQIQIRMIRRFQNVLRNGVDRFLFTLSLVVVHVEIGNASGKSGDMDQLVGGDIQKQRGQPDKRTGPVYGIENPVILQADPIKIKPVLGVGALFFIAVLAKMGKYIVVDFMIFQASPGLDVITPIFNGGRRQAEMTGDHFFRQHKRPAGLSDFVRIETAIHAHPHHKTLT